MKTSNIVWIFITFGAFLLLVLYLPSNEPEPKTYIMHRPNPFDVDTVLVADSMYYPSMKPIPPHTWEWMEEVEQPIVEKPER